MALDMSKITIASFLKVWNKGASPKRCLFGPVNREESSRLLREQLSAQERESREKWNFDFRTETPMAGRYQWERVATDENRVPAAYAMPYLTPQSPNRARICKALSFSSKLNKNSNNNGSNVNETDSINKQTVMEGLERLSPVVTVTSTTAVRRENTPGSMDLQQTPQASTNSQQNNSQSQCSNQEESSCSVPQTSGRGMKRKANQTNITEFFPVKKSKSLIAKRRLDL